MFTRDPDGATTAPLTVADEPGGRLLCVGPVTPTTGQHLLVEALARLAGPRWTCWLVGSLERDRGYVDAVRGLVSQHGLGGRVPLVGALHGPGLDASYATADLLVLPAPAGTDATVVTAALARGVPVLAAAVGGVAATIGRAPDGTRPGLLVPAGDVATLAGELQRWLGDPRLRSAARAAASRRRADAGAARPSRVPAPARG